MNVNPQFFSNFWLLVGALCYGWVLLKSLRSVQWWRLRNPHDLTILLYTILGVFVMWLMNTDIRVGETAAWPSLHLLGAALVTLMFGWAFAVLAMSVVIIAFTLITEPLFLGNLLGLPWNILLTGVLPVSLAYVLFRLIDRYLPNNFFIYIFFSAFFNAALALASVIATTTLVHLISGAYPLDTLLYTYLPYGLILVFPEAFITGMLMSIFVAYRPQWVSTFDDQRYLKNR
jgi:uncharacterized membrane protein